MGSLIEEIDGGTLPGLDEWRHHHETGETSAEMVELSDRSVERYGDKK
jgi:hypothetical protein